MAATTALSLLRLFLTGCALPGLIVLSLLVAATAWSGLRRTRRIYPNARSMWLWYLVCVEGIVAGPFLLGLGLVVERTNGSHADYVLLLILGLLLMSSCVIGFTLWWHKAYQPAVRRYRYRPLG